jgi:hypothetical protein
MAKRRRRGGHPRKGDVRHGAKVTLGLLPSLADKPPAHQIAVGKLIAAEWRDPADLDALRREGRTVAGWRRSCVLRRSQQCNASSPFTEQHVAVADIMRRLYDVARLGYSAPKDGLLPVTAIMYRPALGPSKRAEASAKAARDFARAWAILADYEQSIVEALILNGVSIEEVMQDRHWCHEKTVRLLVAALDRLCEHFDQEIDQQLSMAA